MLAEVIYENFAVDLWRMHRRPAFPQQLRLLRRPLQYYVELFADERLAALLADLLLNLHQLAPSALDLARRDLLIEVERLCALLVRVAEDAEPIELSCLHKFTELLEILGGLTGEAHDERSPQRQVRNRLPHLLDRLQENISRSSTLHLLQNVRRSMLQGNVHVRADLLVIGH